MKLSGFDSALVFTKFDDSSFTQIEDFMRHEFDVETVPHCETVDNYLGIYQNFQENFKLLCGHKLFLNLIKETCERAYTDNPTLPKANAKFVDEEPRILSDPAT